MTIVHIGRSFVRDLDWEELGGRLEAATLVGGYVIMPESRELHFQTEEFVHDGYFESKRVLMARGAVEDLKALANEHHESLVKTMLV